MPTVSNEYEGKHRIERPLNADGWAGRDHIKNGLREIPTEPRHERDES